jgi:two-component system cell cycle sensor histidine kinase PleC
VGFANAQKVLAPGLMALDAAAQSPAVLDALDCLRIAITMYDSRGRMTYANQHFDYLFRTLPGRDALMGVGYGEIVRMEIANGEIGHEMLTRGEEAFVASRCKQLSSGDFRPVDIVLSDGRIVEIKSRRTGDGGSIVLWADVTAARNAFGRLEDAIELSADAFAFFDRADRMVVCNKEFAALYGRGIDQLKGTPFRDMIVDAVTRGRVKIEGDKAQWIERRMDLHNAPAGAMTLETPSGAAYLVRDRRTRDGRVTVLTDVTDNRRAEAALAEQTRSLEKTKAELAQSANYLADLTQRLDVTEQSADATKKTLLRTMSHELKTPLNAIIGFSDLLNQMADRFTHEQVKEYATLIHAGGHNLLRLINQILDLTKLAAGKFEPKHQRLDVSGALWVAKDDFAERAAVKNIEIDVDGCPVGLLAEVDEAAFGQMIAQLMTNAVTFTPDGGRVTLSAWVRDGRINLSIADNGPGVPAEDLGRILQPFEQGGRSTTDHEHGAGLGLTLTKAFAEVHGGALAIASEHGKGFTAIIELPEAR